MNRKKLLAELKKLGVKYVHFQYSGEGDSGGIEDTTAFGPLAKFRSLRKVHEEILGDLTERVELPQALAEAAENEGYEILAAKYAGWEDGDGGSGSITLDVEKDRIRHTHNANFMDYTTTENEEKFAGNKKRVAH